MEAVTQTDVIISTRIRLARNFYGHNFPSIIRGTDEEKSITQNCMRIMRRIDNFKFYSMSELDEITKNSFVERYVVSSLLAKTKNGAVAISKDGFLSVMFNEEDHIREQYMVKGLDFKKCYDNISVFDRTLGANCKFASLAPGYYYTACPTNLGTGMRASVMLFLPALSHSGQIDSIIQRAKREGMTVRGAFGEGSSSVGYYYQLSNDVTVGDPKTIMEEVSAFALTVSDDENDARYASFNVNKVEYADRCLRALGTLTHSISLSYDEFVELISYVKLGVSMGFIHCDEPTKIDDLTVTARKNSLFLTPLAKKYKLENELRAAYVKNTLKGLNCGEKLSEIFP